MLRKAELLCSDSSPASDEQFQVLREEAMEIDKDCTNWATNQSEEWIPRTIGTISAQHARAAGFEDCWPGNVDTYFDRMCVSPYSRFTIADIDSFCLCCVEYVLQNTSHGVGHHA